MGQTNYPRTSALGTPERALSVWRISEEAGRPSDVVANCSPPEYDRAENLDDLVEIIAAAGSNEFGTKLIAFLESAFGAKHCSVFTYDDERPILLTATSFDGSDTALEQIRAYLDQKCWKDDPMVAHVIMAPPTDAQLMRVSVSSLPQCLLRDMVLSQTECREWVAIFGGLPGTTVALNMHRPFDFGQFTQGELIRLRRLANILLTIIAKHAQILLRTGNLHSALSSLSDISLCLDLCPHQLASREKEVCARMLFGMSSAGIAADLDISKQTVLTYRKRTYSRLGICCQHELFIWFAAQWQALHPNDDEALRTLWRVQRRQRKRRPEFGEKGVRPASTASMALGILHDAAHVVG